MSTINSTIRQRATGACRIRFGALGVSTGAARRAARYGAFLLFVILLLILQEAVGADTYLAPQAQLRASTDGRYGFKVIPGNARHPDRDAWIRSTGILFTLKPGGQERVLWKRRLANIPGRVVFEELASDSQAAPLVATVESFLSKNHWLVVYGRDAKVLRDLTFSQMVSLLLPEELAAIQPDPGRPDIGFSIEAWINKSHFEFANGALNVTLLSGRTIRIDGFVGNVAQPKN